MMTPELLIANLVECYGYEVDLSYAYDYINIVGAQFAEVNGFHDWLQNFGFL